MSIDSNRLRILEGRMVQNYENISRINSSIYLISVDDGFVIMIDEDALRQSDIKLPYVLIRRVENITDKITTIASNGSQGEIEIPHSENNIRISYSLPFYRQEKIRFQYYLEGYSHQWSDWSTQSQKEFTNLDQGTYHFRVRAKIYEQNVSPETVLNFTVLAPWYAGRIAFV